MIVRYIDFQSDTKDEGMFEKLKEKIKQKGQQIKEKIFPKKQPVVQPPVKKNTPIKKEMVKKVAQPKNVRKAVGMKRKGRLPSKLIVNKLGKHQTVYYRPDKNTKSMYIDPTKMSREDYLLGYRDSYKRMLFMDHDGEQNWLRQKGDKDHAQGNAMITKLDELAAKHGFSYENFDGKQEKFIKEDHFKSDEFLAEAESIYADLYQVGQNPNPHGLINRVFQPIKSRIHSKGAQLAMINAVQKLTPFVKMKHAQANKKLGYKVGETPKSSLNKVNKNMKVVEKNNVNDIDSAPLNKLMSLKHIIKRAEKIFKDGL